MKNFLDKLRATQIIMLGFLITILSGTFLLMLPFSSASGEWTPTIDALFTSASAVCITGLVVVNTSAYWSVFGQCVIMLLVQLGGLGFMSFVTMIFLALGKKITMRERSVIQESFNINESVGLISFAKSLFIFAMSAELIGAVILAFKFLPDYGVAGSIYRGVFHSITAFCNAGFDIIGANSFSDYSGDLTVNLTIMLLIITGGLGFPVVMDIGRMLRNIFMNKHTSQFSFSRLRLQSKVVIVTTGVLILSGALFTLIFEWNNVGTIGCMKFHEKILSAFFQSVTLRTAGFFTIDQGAMEYSTKIISTVLMFIGGSPAGTAGGAKTVTLAVIIIAVISLVKGNEEINAFNRKIGMDILQKSLSIVIMMMLVVAVSIVILSETEAGLMINRGGEFELMDIVYEVVSAIGTVGLSTGITPFLSGWGKLVIVICMYIGRIGPISLAISLTRNRYTSENNIHYPEGSLIVG